MASPLHDEPSRRRPSVAAKLPSAPMILTMNGHSASMGEGGSRAQHGHGIQIVNEDKEFNKKLSRSSPQVSTYLAAEKVISAGFNYHLVSVFGSQSTGKSTLLNQLFGTQFNVMAEEDRRQTTRGMWLSKNKREGAGADTAGTRMADNILVVDVEGTDGRERGEDQDFERKSALFALATSEVLIINMWEHQVGLYQGANMGLLKTVFEVNVQLFLKSGASVPRSLLFFVIRDHLGHTPLVNLRKTLIQDLTRIWASLSKPAGLEASKIEDYFDFAFVALPHKVLQPEKFVAEVAKLSLRFREGYKDRKLDGLLDETTQPLFQPGYHRRIPADGFAIYARDIWDQIVSNKDLDLPTQQELLAQFRCDEIARDTLARFDEAVAPLEKQQQADGAGGSSGGRPAAVVPGLGEAMTAARSRLLHDFDAEASRYHKAVYSRRRAELVSKADARLLALLHGQLQAATRAGVKSFEQAVASAVQAGQKRGGPYDFARIVEAEKGRAAGAFDGVCAAALVPDAGWDLAPARTLFGRELDEASLRLRADEMRRLAARVERWLRASLADAVGLQFNALGSGRAGAGAPDSGDQPAPENQTWDRVWALFTHAVGQAEAKFTERAHSYDASADEVDVGLWRLRRKAWAALRSKIDDEVMDGNILLKLRENFEDKFRYDEAGVPRIWRPTDDINGLFTRARESTLTLIPLLSRFRLFHTSQPPPLDAWIGQRPAPVSNDAAAAADDDLPPIGGVDDDDDEQGRSLDDETTVLSDAKQQDLTVRFKRAADGVYVEAKRSAIGGVTQVPWYFYALLAVLGWNEFVAVIRNPVYFLLIIFLAAGAYITYNLNLWGPMIRMAEAATQQAVEVGKERLRDFLESTETGRQAIAMSHSESRSPRSEDIELDTLSNGDVGRQKEAPSRAHADVDDI